MDSVLGLELSENYASHSTAMEAGMSLSTREHAIVLLMGHGFTNKMIARQLSIAPETVKSHAKRIFWKLAVQTRAQAVYRASALGLIALHYRQRVLEVSDAMQDRQSRIGRLSFASTGQIGR